MKDVMNKNKEKLKQILSNKFNLAKDHIYNKKGFLAVIDYHHFLGSSIELKSILNQIIIEEKISPIYLQTIFNDFTIAHFLEYEVSEEIKFPFFYTAEIDKKYKLSKGFLKLLHSDYKDYKKDPKQLHIDPDLP